MIEATIAWLVASWRDSADRHTLPSGLELLFD